MPSAPLIKQGGQLQIKKVSLSGPIKKFKNILVAKPSVLSLIVTYRNQGRTVRATIYQQLGKAWIRRRVLFRAGAELQLKVDYKLRKPEKVVVIADIRKRRFLPQAHFEKVLPFGIAEFKPRPVETYPEPNAENERIDIRPKWEEGARIYPEPVPEDIEIIPKELKFVSGVLMWDIAYRVPVEKTRVRISYEVVNRSDKVLTIKEWSFMVSILYEDMQHMSYASTKTGVKDRKLRPNQRTRYTVEVGLPSWVWGYVTITHALKFYKDGLFCYAGGPLWDFKLGRVLIDVEAGT